MTEGLGPLPVASCGGDTAVAEIRLAVQAVFVNEAPGPVALAFSALLTARSGTG